MCKTGYPIAAIGYYGPGDQFASKVAVGILLSEEEEEASHLQRWFAREKDVRFDEPFFRKFWILSSHSSRVGLRLSTALLGVPTKKGLIILRGRTVRSAPTGPIAIAGLAK